VDEEIQINVIKLDEIKIKVINNKLGIKQAAEYKGINEVLFI